MPASLRQRQIHLDFHTSIDIPDVASKWDANAFADRMKEAEVNSVTVFAKCHHGHMYMATDHESRHPSLPKGLDLVGEQVEALHSRDINAPIYISVLFDEYAANTYRDWVAVNEDGSYVGRSPLRASWFRMDMCSPYTDYLADQLDMVLKQFAPTDGVFMDICFDVDSCSKWAIDSMLKQGYDPKDKADRKKHAAWVSDQYMKRYTKQIEAAHTKSKPAKIWYNSRPKVRLAEEKKYLRHIEIEALPTGAWGYTYFPLNVRFARTFGMPMLGMTGRFHKSWADFGGLKPEAALKYECSQMLAHGCACSVGDQLHPRGTLDDAVYELIGNVYRHTKACEPWTDGAKVLSDIAVVRELVGEGDGNSVGPGNSEEGITNMLQQLQQQFDFIPPDHKLKGYKLVIVPENVSIDDKLLKKLKAHVKEGGKLLICGKAAVDGEGQPIMKSLGLSTHGDSPYQTTFLRFGKTMADLVPDTDHVIYERGIQMKPVKGAKALATVVAPYFDRDYNHFCSHAQTPTDKATRYAAAVQHGDVITIAYPIFQAYATHGNLPCRELVRGCIDRLLPRPLIKADAPSHMETTYTQHKKRTVVHVLSYVPKRRTPKIDIVEEATPLVNAKISVKLKKQPKKATLQPIGEAIDFDWDGKYVTVSLTSDRGHDMIVFE